MMKSIFKIILWALLVILPNLAVGQGASDVLIQGTITDAKTGETLIAVNVVEMDANGRIVNATITDFNGHYVLRVKNTSNTLSFTFIGFTAYDAVVGTNRILNVELEENVLVLEEAVITADKMHSEGAFAIPQREISTAVQTISTEEFEGMQVTSIDDALQGRIAGLDIVANSGDLGSGTSMRIRGTSSINGIKEPLIVLNGVPYEVEIDDNFDFANANDEEFASMLSINPDDILEISVLKDAASTAIWGSKGANGVLMITTKKGAKGPTRVDYTHRFTRAVQPKGLNMLDGDGYTMLMKQSYFNAEQNEYAADRDEYNYDPSYAEYENFNNNTDWIDEVSQVGYTTDHYLSISGGGERARFRLAGGYLSQTGTLIGQKLERYSSRTYFDYAVSDRLKFINEVAFAYTENNRNYGKLLEIAYRKMPNVSVYEQDIYGDNTGSYYNISPLSSLHPNQRDLRNPVALGNLAENKLATYRITPVFRLQYDITDPEKQMLRYNAYVSFDLNNDKGDSFLPQEATNNVWNDVDHASDHDKASITVQTDNNLTWKPRFTNPNHVLQLYGSFQARTSSSSYRGTSSSGYLRNADASGVGYVRGSSSGRYASRSMGVLGRVHYSYKGKYIFGGTWRRDGSTRFGDENKFGDFPGVSFKWIISEEPFMMATKNWLSTLALRPSWGVSGNQPRFEYLHFSRYSNYGSYAGINAAIPSLRYSNLQWEETSSWNYGLDAGFFDDRFVIDANVYDKRTRKLLFEKQAVAASSGQTLFAVQNVGTMDNVGWELNFYTSNAIKIKKFTADFNFNLSNNINTVIELDKSVLKTFNPDYFYNNGEYLSRLQINNSFGSIYGFRYKGVYQYNEYVAGTQENAPVARDSEGDVILDQNDDPIPMTFGYGQDDGKELYEFEGGDAAYEDINNDGTIDELDIVYLGNSNPKVNGGFGTNLRYGNFSCTAFFNFRYGNKIVNYARMSAENMYTSDNQSVAVNWRWRKDGDVTNMPRALYLQGYNWLGSDRYVEDGSFIRFKQLTFRYSLPQKSIKKYHLNKLSFYLTFNNLYVFTKYSGVDPEVGYGSWGVSMDRSQTPRSKSFTFGTTIGF